MKIDPTNIKEFVKRFAVAPGSKVDLKKDFDPGDTAGYEKPENAAAFLDEGVEFLADYQEKLYAENARSLLVVLQALDAAGKDSTIEHVMSGVNPQGCQVTSFKAPSVDELDHGYPVARGPARCPRAATSASSTARTTRKCWWCASIPSS